MTTVLLTALLTAAITVAVLALLFSLVRHHASPQGLLYRSFAWVSYHLPGGRRLWQALAPHHEEEPPLASWLLLPKEVAEITKSYKLRLQPMVSLQVSAI